MKRWQKLLLDRKFDNRKLKRKLKRWRGPGQGEISSPTWPTPTPTPQQQEDGYILWTCDCAEPFLGNVGPDDCAYAPGCITMVGEYEPLIIGLWGLRDIGPVRLEMNSPNFDIKIARVDYDITGVPWPASREIRRYDVPYGLIPENVAKLTANHNAVFWLTIYTQPGTWPGTYSESLMLHFSPKSGLQPRKIDYTVQVLPFTLPDAHIAFGMYYNQGRLPEKYRYKNWELAAFEDMAEHGHTSAFISGKDNDVDFHNLHQQIKARTRTGLLRETVPFLLGGHAPETYADYPAFIDSLGYAQLEHAWPEPLIYGPDEIGAGNGATLAARDAVRPAIRTATTLKTDRWKTYCKHFDIWIFVGGNIDSEAQRAAEMAKAELWTYMCNRRGTNATFHRFYAGLYMWALRLKGNFIWAYVDEQGGFSHVIPADDGPMATVGWEARREGIKDYRLLSALEKTVNQHDGPAEKEICIWLADLRKRATWKAGRHGFTENEQLILDRENPCKNIASQEYPQIRRQAEAYLLTLQKGKRDGSNE